MSDGTFAVSRERTALLADGILGKLDPADFRPVRDVEHLDAKVYHSMRKPIASNNVPIILLPGMATDDRIFRLQRAAFPNLITPTWIEPHCREPLSAYAERLARSIDPGTPCFVGGASFGGAVALEMAVFLRAQACFLIGSLRSRRELQWRYRALRPIMPLGPERLGRIAGLCSRWFGRYLPDSAGATLRHWVEPQSAFMRWATWAILSWRPSAGVIKVPVYQIHGSADRTLPVRLTRPDVVVAGGGHVISVTHSEEVNEFLRTRIDEHIRLGKAPGRR